MTCKRGWNREFIDLHLTKVFRSGDLRKHRAKVLRDREKALLPAMQIFVEATKEIRKVAELFGAVLAKNRELLSVRAALLRERDVIRQKLRICAKADEADLMALLDVNSEKYGKNEGVVLRVSFDQEVLSRRQMRAMNIMEGRDADDNTVKEVREFIQRCPGEGCRGYLSTAYKCGVCAKYACSDCLAVKGEDRDAAHTCDESAKATAALIRRETKPCPKCGVRIYKIDGCFIKDTPILLWDGTVKMSQDITVGDTLVGDDGLSRTVTDLCSGGDEMYEVSQKSGVSYTVNSKHKLALKFSGEILEIEVDKYLALSDSEKEGLMGFKKDNSLSEIKVTPVGRGTYYGWSVDSNKRFLLPDMTVVRNCDQMWCTQDGCQTAFSWNTGHIVTGVVHNPHYYEWLRRQNNGQMPRQAGDIPCGGLPNAWQFTRLIQNTSLNQAERTHIANIHRCFGDTIHVRLPDFPARRLANTNKDIDVKYLMNELSEGDWQKTLEQRETRFERKKEFGQIFTTFAHVGSEMIRTIEAEATMATRHGGTAASLASRPEMIAFMARYREVLLPQILDLRIYTNKSLMDAGKRSGCAFPQIDKDWHYVSMRKEGVVEDGAVVIANAPAPAVAPVPAPAPAPAPRATRFDAGDFVDDENVEVY